MKLKARIASQGHDGKIASVDPRTSHLSAKSGAAGHKPDDLAPGQNLGYGSITIIGTGGTRELFNNISDPLKFRKVFQQLV